MIKTIPFSLSIIFSGPCLSANFSLDEQKNILTKKNLPVPQKFNIKPPKFIDVDPSCPDLYEGMTKGRNEYRKKNYEKAHEWFELAALYKGGSAVGMYHLGSMYFRGQGATKNIVLGKSLLEAASHAGFHKASFDLGLRYYFGKDLPKFLPYAQKYFQKLPLSNLKYRSYYGLCLYLNNEDYAKRIKGIEYVISAANDGYTHAKEVLETENLREILLFLKYAQGKQLYQQATTKESKIKSLNQIINALEQGYVPQDTEPNDWAEKLSTCEANF